MEVGIGGRLDPTNVFSSPVKTRLCSLSQKVVCGVSSLGMDHMNLLGNTLASIAGEKAGIFKSGRPAVSAPQWVHSWRVLTHGGAEMRRRFSFGLLLTLGCETQPFYLTRDRQT